MSCHHDPPSITAPEIEADPHASDLSDNNEYLASDEDESTDKEELFEFDDYNVDEAKSVPIPMMPRSRLDDSFKSGLNYPAQRHCGVLLWSSHWFFLNHKQKHILFISVWARMGSTGNLWTSGDMTSYHGWSSSVDSGSERFLRWEGATLL
ncbi:hypothetical protein IW261DRAFT_1655862 [Armillaria novae-zelandiae]|uniref:Uncharacterized protein n=1 Tax=Armillaria novae-zelandiae TaxID=153914 RepID=A0AA39NXT9_9AGAR|nr:hypothetical protein IW261DRAFT_1655862 [Armillaria novae-zelandiae]